MAKVMQAMAMQALFDSQEQMLVNKIFKRVVLVLLLVFVIAFFNRISIGLVGPDLSASLGLSATQFGFANFLFYFFYLICGVPLSLLLTKFKLKYYLAIVCIVLGLLSGVSIYIDSAFLLYISRILFGICEVSLLPAIFLYLSHYLPSTYRARANALFMLSMPITMLFGSLLATLIIELHAFFFMHFWQTIFLLQAIASVVVGIVLLFYLDSNVEQASYLNTKERVMLKLMIQKDKLKLIEAWGQDSQQALNLMKNSLTKIVYSLCNKPIILYTLSYFFLTCSLSAINICSVSIILDSLDTYSQINTYLYVALTQFITIIFILFLSWHSDVKQERKFHIWLAFMLGGCGWSLSATADSSLIQVIGISFASAGAFAAMSLFWTLPDQNVNNSTIAIGFINSIGNLGSGIAPWLIGYCYDYSHSYALSMYIVGGLLVIGAYVILFIAMDKFRPRAQI